eukprot:IDg9204t1
MRDRLEIALWVSISSFSSTTYIEGTEGQSEHIAVLRETRKGPVLWVTTLDRMISTSDMKYTRASGFIACKYLSLPCPGAFENRCSPYRLTGMIDCRVFFFPLVTIFQRRCSAKVDCSHIHPKILYSEIASSRCVFDRMNRFSFANNMEAVTLLAAP